MRATTTGHRPTHLTPQPSPSSPQSDSVWRRAHVGAALTWSVAAHRSVARPRGR